VNYFGGGFSTGMRLGTSVFMMRTALAIGMAMLLLSIVTLCPVLACPLTASAKSCCHRSESPACPVTIQACPYLLVDKGQTAPVVAIPLSASEVASSHLPLFHGRSFVRIENRLPDLSGLHLRIRVLLI
jgi:hypothetical protein